MAAKQSLLLFCFHCIIITSYCVPFACASINATISVSIEPTEETLQSTKTIIHSGDYFLNVSSRASFFVIQAHSLTASLRLSDDRNFGNESTAAGLSVGLVQEVNKTTDVYTFYLTGVNTTSALISVQGYDDKAPIPGGCNTVLHPKDAPYQVLGITKEMIAVLVQPAAEPGKLCNDVPVKLEMYHYHIRSGCGDEAGYYDSVANMMTVEGIMKYGTKVEESKSNSSLRRYYNNYQGIGIVFGVIARSGNSSSAYVPAATFGCKLLQGETTCSNYYITPFSVLLILLGLFAAFHEDAGTLYSNCVIFVLVTLYIIGNTNLDVLYLLLLIPIIWVVTCMYSILKLLKLDQFFNAPVAGYLLGDWIFFRYFIDTDSFQNDLQYWTIIHAVSVFLLAGIFFPFKHLTSLTTSFIYLVSALSMCFGGVAYYIFIVDVRRIVVPNFYKATLDPPHLISDIVANVIAATFVGTIGLLLFLNRTPSPAAGATATTPLLGYRRL